MLELLVGIGVLGGTAVVLYGTGVEYIYRKEIKEKKYSEPRTRLKVAKDSSDECLIAGACLVGVGCIALLSCYLVGVMVLGG